MDSNTSSFHTTNPNPNGSEEYNTVQERLDYVLTVLKQYETNLGLNNIKPQNEEANSYLNLTSDELKKMSAEEVSIAAYCLANYSAYIQKCYNEDKSKLDWAEQNLKITVADQLDNYQYCSFEDKMTRAISDNEIAIKLNRIKIYAEARTNWLFLLATRIEFMAKTLSDLSFTKRKKE